jgi:C4-dicarboxylate-specific signal transduction histidine kinase
MKTPVSAGVHSGPAAKIPRRGEASDLKISPLSGSELDMESNAIVSNATLYSLLQTVHANQTKYDIPDLSALLRDVAALPASIATLSANLATLRSDLDSKLALLDAKLDQISAQVTPPETVNLNLETATITPKE